VSGLIGSVVNLFAKRKYSELAASLCVTEFQPPAPLQTAVLFLVFNRPDTTQTVFDAIRKAKPPRLYVAADAARESKSGEAEKVQQVREIVKAVDWDCEVKTLFREKNLGCKYAVSSAIDWFFENEEQGIILEDDTLPSQSFFWFCESMLDKYSASKTVMHVGGYKPENIGFDAYSISFTRAVHVWGWASWRDRWKQYHVECRDHVNDLDALADYEYFNNSAATNSRVAVLKKLCANLIDTWDFQWSMAVRFSGGVTIRPSVNLVENIGLGHADATHTMRGSAANSMNEIAVNNIVSPPWILPNRELEKAFEQGLTRWSVIQRLFK
jgi:hypothetical protein